LCLLLFFPIHERLSFESGRMGISESRELSMCFLWRLPGAATEELRR
jgi:hypothetical protein